jgi:prephenate dehydrogenase
MALPRSSGVSGEPGLVHPGDNGPVRISILGFGLIGGSIARTLHARADSSQWEVTAWSRNPAPVEQAVVDGALASAAATIEAAIDGTELVILAAPPLVCLELVDRLAGPLRARLPEDATVTDVASAKARIVARADAARLPFIGGHPMAGREVSGYGAALPDLFVGRPWVTVLGRYARFTDGARIGDLVEACGAIQVPMDATVHDRAVAAISHLPLVVSAALVEAVAGGPDEPEHRDWAVAEALAATGWAGMTRLARGEPSMSAGIAVTNADALAARLHAVRAAIDEWLVELEGPGGPDAKRLEARFRAARERMAGSDRA